MKAIVFLSVLIFIGHVRSESSEWETFKLKFQKSYSSQEEEELRQTIWAENSKFIEKHNKEADEGLHTFRVAMNHFGDLTSKEFSDMISTNSKSIEARQQSLKTSSSKFKDVIPDQFDWRVYGCVSPVRLQGECNDVYAYYVTEGVAGAKCAATRQFVPLSVQQIIDCSRSFGNQGCQGGFYEQTYQYVIKTGGLESEKSYPSEGGDGKCHFDPALVETKITDYAGVETGNETALTLAIANIGPISVAIDAGEPSFQFYSSGIYYDPNCLASKVDHYVLAIGYGFTPKAQMFYQVKNSWGTDWGEKGFVRMSRYRDNNCGIASFASYPIF